MAYSGPNKVYVNKRGEVFRNDRHGNAQYAFYECVRECQGG